MPGIIGNPGQPKQQQVAVEYTSKGNRVRKVFTGTTAAYQARSFYARQLKAGNDPKVVSAAS